MEVCTICGREFKNANGLRLHMRVHKDVKELVESEDLAMARVKLYKADGELLVSYVVHGIEEIEKAKVHAEKKGLKIEISDIVTVNI